MLFGCYSTRANFHSHKFMPGVDRSGVVAVAAFEHDGFSFCWNQSNFPLREEIVDLLHVCIETMLAISEVFR